MRNKSLNGALFFAICAVFTAALCVAYSQGRAAEGSIQAQKILEEAQMRTAAYVTATERPIEAPVVETPKAAPAEEAVPVEDVPVESETPVDIYREDVPLSRELQEVLREACEATNISFELALGLIEVESNFDQNAVSSCGAYGLMQLNPAYFPPNLDSADNIRVGMSYLNECITRYEDLYAGLRAYNRGWDDGDRVYANAVVEAGERWER